MYVNKPFNWGNGQTYGSFSPIITSDSLQIDYFKSNNDSININQLKKLKSEKP